MHRSSVSTILRLKDVKFDRVCVFENSFYSLSRKHILVLISSWFFEGGFNVWCQVYSDSLWGASANILF